MSFCQKPILGISESKSSRGSTFVTRLVFEGPLLILDLIKLYRIPEEKYKFSFIF